MMDEKKGKGEKQELGRHSSCDKSKEEGTWSRWRID